MTDRESTARPLTGIAVVNHTQLVNPMGASPLDPVNTRLGSPLDNPVGAPPGDRLLVCQRGKPFRIGTLPVPGGAREVGATRDQAARRQLRKQCRPETGESPSGSHLANCAPLHTLESLGPEAHRIIGIAAGWGPERGASHWPTR